MESGLLVVSAGLTIGWSLYIYNKAQLMLKDPRTSLIRFLILLAPSSFLLLVLFSGWQAVEYIRLDIVGLLFLDLFMVLGFCADIAGRLLKKEKQKLVFLTVFWVNFGLSVLLVLFIYVIRLFPPLLIKVVSVLKEVRTFNLMAFAWNILDPESSKDDVTNFVTRILIAVIAYIPVSLLRFLYVNRKLKRLEDDLGILKQRLAGLEKKPSPCETANAVPGIQGNETPIE